MAVRRRVRSPVVAGPRLNWSLRTWLMRFCQWNVCCNGVDMGIPREGDDISAGGLFSGHDRLR